MASRSKDFEHYRVVNLSENFILTFFIIIYEILKFLYVIYEIGQLCFHGSAQCW